MRRAQMAHSQIPSQGKQPKQVEANSLVETTLNWLLQMEMVPASMVIVQHDTHV